MTHRKSSFLIPCLFFAFAAAAQIDDATKQFSHDIFKELIEINTTDSVGNVTTASEAMAKRLLDAGFPAADVQVLGPNDRKKNMVVRLHGSGKKEPFCSSDTWTSSKRAAKTGQRTLSSSWKRTVISMGAARRT